jgi:hypothetical protein
VAGVAYEAAPGTSLFRRSTFCMASVRSARALPRLLVSEEREREREPRGLLHSGALGWLWPPRQVGPVVCGQCVVSKRSPRVAWSGEPRRRAANPLETVCHQPFLSSTSSIVRYSGANPDAIQFLGPLHDSPVPGGGQR